jgi:hydrogenase expression/formation protein HypE
MATESGCAITISENLLPLSGGVKGACELLGLDPLYSANEGVLIAVVAHAAATLLLHRMRGHLLGKEAAIIGEVSAGDERTSGMVLLKTVIGGTRIVDMLPGEQLPRIC